MKLDISVIILTYNEEKHIHRCVENVKRFAHKVYVIDCFSSDATKQIAESLGAEVIGHEWPGNQAEQFNWAIDHLCISTEWILRLDADEYLMDELIRELEQRIESIPKEVSGIVFKRRYIFLGRWVKRATYPRILRMFRTGKGRSEQRLMDEHIQLSEGEAMEFECDFVDENLNDLGWWTSKHNNYALREAVELLDVEFALSSHSSAENRGLGNEATHKRMKKNGYAKLPLFWRSFAYFLYRYFFKLGFLEGKEGFLWHFLQGWWYRTLVDAKIFEIKKMCGNDKEKIRLLLKEKYNISLN